MMMISSGRTKKNTRAAHRDRSVRNGRSRHTVTVPVPLSLRSCNQTGRWTGRTTPVITVKCMAVNGLDGNRRVTSSK